jgi:ATP-dependent DNA ligase
MDLELESAGIDPLRATQISLEELPVNWALQKPLADYNPDLVENLIRQNRIVAEKKYNGHRLHILVNNQQEVKLYQRTSKALLNDYLPSLAQEIASMDLPANTLLDGEVYVPSTGTESLEQLQQIIACGSPEKNRHLKFQPKVALFDCLLWNSHNLSLKPYRDRFGYCPQGDQLHPAEVLPIKSLEQGLSMSQEAGIEGLVLWDLQAPHKLNTMGNTKRGRAYKLKPEQEEDFIAFGFKEGRGQAMGKVGTLTIGKFIGGQPVIFGEVGSGLSDQEKLMLTDTTRYPFVVEVRHFGLDDQGRVSLPSIKKVHLDKSIKEVV